MKSIVFVVAIFLGSISFQATSLATPNVQEVADSFKTVVQNHLDSYQEDSRVMVYDVKERKNNSIFTWIKSKSLVPYESKYDIRKRTSKENQYIGILEYKMRTLFTDYQASKEAAEACEDFTSNDDSINPTYRITFLYIDGSWRPISYQHKCDIEDIPELSGRWDDEGNNNERTRVK